MLRPLLTATRNCCSLYKNTAMFVETVQRCQSMQKMRAVSLCLETDNSVCYKKVLYKYVRVYHNCTKMPEHARSAGCTLEVCQMCIVLFICLKVQLYKEASL